ETNPLIEYETVALVVLATALLKVLQNAALELEDLLEARLLHVGPRLFAANAAGAKHHDRLLLEIGGQAIDGGRKIAKVIDAQRHGILERAEFHLVIVARIEQRDGPPGIEPLLELLGSKLRRSAPARFDAVNPERNDLSLETNQHAVE